MRVAALLLALGLSAAACSDSTGANDPVVWTRVVATYQSTCGLSDGGGVYCWFLNDSTALNASEGWMLPSHKATAITAGAAGACALTDEGEAYCWGDGGRAANVLGGYTFREISGGNAGGCGITTAGATLCWNETLLPAPLAGDPGLARLGDNPLGGGRMCGLTAAGQAYCWPSPAQPATAVPTALRFSHITSAPDHDCALTADGAAYCWGTNVAYVLGITNDPRAGCTSTVQSGGTVLTCASPQAVQTERRFTEIHTARWTCGLGSDGPAYCWGWDYAGGMGAAPSSITYATCGDWPCTPVARAVDGDVRFASLGPPSAYHECAVTAEGAIYCWGSVTAQGLPRADSTQSVQTTPVRLREPRF